jgi:hypothetical protein
MRNALIIVIMLAIFSPNIVLAHESEQSFEKSVGNYVVDIGYDASGEIKTGDSLTFDIKLWNADKSAEVPFGGVWAEIIGPDSKVLFAGDINPSSGRTGFSSRFLQPGNYTISIRYEKQGDALTSLADASFPLNVEGRANPVDPSNIVFAIAGVVTGMILKSVLSRRQATQV